MTVPLLAVFLLATSARSQNADFYANNLAAAVAHWQDGFDLQFGAECLTYGRFASTFLGAQSAGPRSDRVGDPRDHTFKRRVGRKWAILRPGKLQEVDPDINGEPCLSADAMTGDACPQPRDLDPNSQAGQLYRTEILAMLQALAEKVKDPSALRGTGNFLSETINKCNPAGS